MACKGEEKVPFPCRLPGDGAFLRTMFGSLDALLEAKKPSTLQYKHMFYPTESHGSVAAKAYYDGMRYLYTEWDIAETDTSAALIKQHYHAIGVSLASDVEPPLGMVSDWGARFLRQPGKADDALEVLKVNVKNFPRTASVHQDLGAGYAQTGNLQEAIAAYKQALALAPNDSQIAQKLKELQEKKRIRFASTGDEMLGIASIYEKRFLLCISSGAIAPVKGEEWPRTTFGIWRH